MRKRIYIRIKKLALILLSMLLVMEEGQITVFASEMVMDEITLDNAEYSDDTQSLFLSGNDVNEEEDLESFENEEKAGETVEECQRWGNVVYIPERYQWDESEGKMTVNWVNNYEWIGAMPWFEWRDEINCVYFVPGIESIGDYSFSDCQFLTKVSIPDGVKRIGKLSFWACRLTSLTLPKGLKTIEERAFDSGLECSKLVIPAGVELVGTNAFINNNSLEELKISNNVLELGTQAFSGLTNLAVVSIGDGCKTIGEKAFNRNYKLKSLDLGNGIESIGRMAFFRCKNLSRLEIPAGVKTISPSAFNGCSGLAKVTIGKGITKIERSVFEGCSNLTSVDIPEGVTTIGEYAFYDCRSLEAVSLPKEIKTIKESAYGECTNIDDVYYAGSQEDWAKVKIEANNESLTNANVHFGEEIPAYYMIQFESDGAEDVQCQAIKDQGCVAEPPMPEKPGYTFEGWYEDNEFTNRWDFTSDVVTKEMMLYAKWKRNQYVVSFESGGGSRVLSQNIIEGEKIKKPVEPTKAGYTFDGWYVDIRFSEVWDFSAGRVFSNKTLYAKWIQNEYIVQYVSNGGTIVDKQEVLGGEKISPPKEPRKEGFIFEGWYSDAALKTSWNFEQDIVVDDITLYAKWVENKKYVVTFDSCGGSVIGPQTVEYGGEIFELRDPVREGYTFLGWYADEAMTSTFSFNTPITSDLTLYAKWQANEYTITFNSGEGSEVAPITAEYGTLITKPADPEKEGHTFLGWYTDEALTDLWDFEHDIVSADMTLFAKWQAGEYTVTFDAGEGTPVLPAAAEYGKTIPMPEPPTRKGYIFDGWCSDEALTTLWNFDDDVVSGDLTLYASWKPITYTVRYAANRPADAEESVLGSTEDSAHIFDQEEPLTLNGFTLEGYTFAGWNERSDGRGRAFSDGEQVKNLSTEEGTEVILYAQWTKDAVITWIVSFKTYSGDAYIPAQQVAEGECAVRPADPERSRCRFLGWYTDEQGKEPYDFSSPVMGNLTLYPFWESIIYYTVSFNLMYDTKVERVEIENGETVDRPEDPSREGYVFSGWYKDYKFTAAYDFDIPVTGNLSLYAKWEYKKDGVTVSDPFSVSFINLDGDPYAGIVQDGNSFSTVYTGSAITPEIGVFGPDGRALVKDADYTVRFSNNQNVSRNKKASVQITGKGVFNGKKTLEFTILPVNLQEAADRELLEVNISAQSGKKAAAALFYRGVKLSSGDFYLSNTAKISAEGQETTVYGKGVKFTGRLEAQEISLLTATDAKRLKLKAQVKANKVYNGSPQTLNSSGGELTVKNGNNMVLKEGTDYEVIYYGNTDAGTVRASIRGINDYALSDAVAVTFKINPDKKSSITAPPAEKEIYYHPNGACPKLDVSLMRSGETVTLREGEDYKVSYSANKKVGTGKYTVSFLGNYKGHPAVRGTFYILRRPFEDPDFIMPDIVYYKPGKYLGTAFVGVDGALLKKTDYTIRFADGDGKTAVERDKITFSAGEKERYYLAELRAAGANYTSSDTVGETDFRLVKESEVEADLCKAKVTVSNAAYTGEAVEPKVSVSVKKNGSWVTLNSSKYHVAYFNNIHKGKGTVLVYGKQDTSTAGYKTATFTISAKNISEFAAK